jgi:hypothetical protein
LFGSVSVLLQIAEVVPAAVVPPTPAVVLPPLPGTVVTAVLPPTPEVVCTHWLFTQASAPLHVPAARHVHPSSP